MDEEIDKENNKVSQVKSQNIKRLISWEGWKKELFWVFFLVLLCFAAYSYKRDIDLCRPYLTDPCSKCQEINNATIEILLKENAHLREQNKLDFSDINLEVVE